MRGFASAAEVILPKKKGPRRVGTKPRNLNFSYSPLRLPHRRVGD